MKADIQAWLRIHDIQFDDELPLPQLLAIAKACIQTPKYVIDKIVTERGHGNMNKNQNKWENAIDEDSCSAVFHVYDNQRHDPKYAEKIKLIHNCQEFVVSNTSVRSPLNIAVIGQPGAGKSSFLNTVFASFNTDSWLKNAPFSYFKQAGLQLHFTERFRRLVT
ncbi:unnamed protein product [Mytilus coruscus]|uniref:G domain-containing protein n=1 Tax=Mytilus coruscus TaxID=42192 RepID=A0A6J8E8G6_MYTCO|nr:unnamed protein product [Mytilus coruscus]